MRFPLSARFAVAASVAVLLTVLLAAWLAAAGARTQSDETRLTAINSAVNSAVGGLTTTELDSLARRLYFAARYDEAAETFARVAVERQTQGEWRSYVGARIREGESWREAGEYHRGLTTINAADSTRRSRIGDNQDLELRARHQRGVVLIRLSLLDEAIDELSAALDASLELADPVQVAEVLQSLGWAYQEVNATDRALSLFRSSLETLRSAREPAFDQRARVFNSIGIHYYGLHNPDSAIVYYTRAAQIRKDLYGEAHPLYATSLANLALAHHLGGDRSVTIPYYAKATEIFANRLGTDHPEVARCFTNLGLFYWEEGKLGLAQLALDRSLEMRTRLLGDDHISLSYTYLLLANVALDKGEFDRAAEFSRDVLRIAGLNSPTPTSSTTEAMLVLAQSLEQLGEHAGADSAYSRSLATLDQSGTESEVPRASINYFRARNLVRWGRSTRALEVINGSCDELTEVLTFNRSTFHDCLILTAEIHVELDSLDRANAVLQGVMSELGVANVDIPVQRLRSIADAWRIRARLQREHYRIKRDIDDLAASMRSLEKSQTAAAILQERYLGKESKRAVLRATATVADSLIATGLSLYHLLGDPSYLEAAFGAAEWRRTAILVDVLHGLEIDGRTWIPRDIALREASLRSSIIQQSGSLRSAGGLAGLSLVELTHEHESVLRHIEATYPEYSNLLDAVRPSRAADILRSIRDDEVVLEFSVLDEDAYSFVLTSDSISVGGRWSSAEVTTLATDLRNAIKSHDYHAFVASSRALYRLLLEPIEQQIHGKHLVIVTDDVLQFVPFEVLLTADVPAGGDIRSYRTLPYLIRNSAISYTYSATLMHELRTRKLEQPPQDFLGLAPVFSSKSRNPRGRVLMVQNADPGAGPLRSIHLPASLEEVRAIRSSFNRRHPLSGRPLAQKTTLLLHGKATEGAFKALNLADYRFIHLATHAFANEVDPDLSGLVLARGDDPDEDGVLHVREVYDLDLNAELVVLSACETGLGKLATGEGIIGLTSGFLYAGAANVMVSLWKADDATTRDLMISFYDVLLSGHSKAEALRQAKLELIARSPVHARPFYWAQFVVIGG